MSVRESRWAPGPAGQQASQERWGGGTGQGSCARYQARSGVRSMVQDPCTPMKVPGAGTGRCSLASPAWVRQGMLMGLTRTLPSVLLQHCGGLTWAPWVSARGTGIAGHAATFLSRNIVKTIIQVRRFPWVKEALCTGGHFTPHL